MFKKVKRTRAFVCLLVMLAVLLVWGFAENAVQAPAADGAAEATVEEALDAPAEDTLERDLAAAGGETDFAGGTVRVIETQEEEETTQIDFVSGMHGHLGVHRPCQWRLAAVRDDPRRLRAPLPCHRQGL